MSSKSLKLTLPQAHYLLCKSKPDSAPDASGKRERPASASLDGPEKETEKDSEKDAEKDTEREGDKEEAEFSIIVIDEDGKDITASAREDVESKVDGKAASFILTKRFVFFLFFFSLTKSFFVMVTLAKGSKKPRVNLKPPTEPDGVICVSKRDSAPQVFP